MKKKSLYKKYCHCHKKSIIICLQRGKDRMAQSRDAAERSGVCPQKKVLCRASNHSPQHLTHWLGAVKGSGLPITYRPLGWPRHPLSHRGSCYTNDRCSVCHHSGLPSGACVQWSPCTHGWYATGSYTMTTDHSFLGSALNREQWVSHCQSQSPVGHLGGSWHYCQDTFRVWSCSMMSANSGLYQVSALLWPTWEVWAKERWPYLSFKGVKFVLPYRHLIASYCFSGIPVYFSCILTKGSFTIYSQKFCSQVMLSYKCILVFRWSKLVFQRVTMYLFVSTILCACKTVLRKK